MRLTARGIAAAMLLTFGIVDPAFADDCAEWDTAVTTTPAPPQMSQAMMNHTRLMRTIPASADVLIIGDSISAGVRPELAQALYPGMSIWNAGIGGDKTQQVLWRMQLLGGRLKPRHVLIILGTNNVGAGDKPCAVAAGMAAVFRRIDELWGRPNVIYVAMPPRKPEGIEESRRQANALIQTYVRPGRTIVDADALATCRDCYVPDGLHLTPEGYRHVSEIIRKTIGVMP